jgi:cation transport protein ChaC
MADFWVFGYGSLMWQPGFPYRRSVPALLSGAHRALCIYSWVHRGTEAQPGLVLGLDRGGACRGVAFLVDADRHEEVLAYLRERELVTAVYRESRRPVRLLEERPRVVPALAFIADRTHPQYAGRLSRAGLLERVRYAHGRSGDNCTYILNTAKHLAELGIRDPTLEWLAAALPSGGES